MITWIVCDQVLEALQMSQLPSKCRQCGKSTEKAVQFFCSKDCQKLYIKAQYNRDRHDLNKLAELVKTHVHKADRYVYTTQAICACGQGTGGPAAHDECRAIQIMEQLLLDKFESDIKDL